MVNMPTATAECEGVISPNPGRTLPRNLIHQAIIAARRGKSAATRSQFQGLIFGCTSGSYTALRRRDERGRRTEVGNGDTHAYSHDASFVPDRFPAAIALLAGIWDQAGETP